MKASRLRQDRAIVAQVPRCRVLCEGMTDSWLIVHRALIRWLALLVPVAVGAGLGLLRTDLQPSTAAMILVLPVVAASATGHLLVGVIAALASAAALDVFLTEPYYSLSIHRRDDVELAIVLVAVGLAVTAIAHWGRRQQEVA